MKHTRIFLTALALVALLGGFSHAQTATEATSRASLAGRPDAWRYKYHNSQWWYYHPNKTWSIWNGSAWSPYVSGVPHAAGYGGDRSAGPSGAGPTRGDAGISATDALPGRSNPQMVGGGIGINGGTAGINGVYGRLPNSGAGLSDTDAVPGRANPQMAGGGIGINGSAVGAANRGTAGVANQRGNLSATDALPGEADRQMTGGGLGVNGSVGGGAGTATAGADQGAARPAQGAPAQPAPSGSGS
jgi:hypothetical protein